MQSLNAVKQMEKSVTIRALILFLFQLNEIQSIVKCALCKHTKNVNALGTHAFDYNGLH